jgi:hypothetical protein
MKLDTFLQLVERLRIFFGKSKPSEDQVLAWFEVLENKVPEGDPLEWIEERIKEDERFFPTNLPRCILQYWQRWQEEHPTQMSPKDVQRECWGDCPDGCRDGLWYVKKKIYDKNGDVVDIVSAVFRCDRCKRSDLLGLELKTREELIEEGWEIEGRLRKVSAKDWERLLGKVPGFVKEKLQKKENCDIKNKKIYSTRRMFDFPVVDDVYVVGNVSSDRVLIDCPF